ncbi:ankyrin repeat domain-containing protein [Alcaligenaceae bacterium CGII-47]|nr:ankyrin repeat domain-containing protein [Alcaligenaceae bacterium CGII-47]
MTNTWNKTSGVWPRLAVACAMALMCAAVAAQSLAPDAWWNALVRDDTADVSTLLQRLVDPNSVDEKTGLPAIMFAVRKQSWKVFDLLSTTPGVQIDAPNRLNETALMYLALLGQTKRAEALIDAGAQVNRLGWTPLHYAASKGRDETLKMLIARRAIVNSPGPDGTTPLMMAALSGRESTVRLLLESGADATMFNLNHQTAADWARTGEHPKLATKLDALAAGVQARRLSDTQKAQSPSSGPEVSAVDKKAISSYFDPDLFVDVPAGQ